jgi:rhamnulokinase
MTGRVHVAFDLGAESGRSIVGHFDGNRIALAEARRFPTRSVRLPEGLYWDALGLCSELTSALAEVHASGAHIRSVGVDSWGVDFGLIDANGALVANPLSHRDGRAAGFVAEALNRVPAEDIYATTGIQLLPFNTLFQLLALDAASALDRAETLLLIPDLLAYWLTGERHVEETNASTTQLLDARTGDWAGDLIQRFRRSCAQVRSLAASYRTLPRRPACRAGRLSPRWRHTTQPQPWSRSPPPLERRPRTSRAVRGRS